MKKKAPSTPDILTLQSEIERLRDALARSERMAEALLKYNPCELIVVDREGRILGISESRARGTSRTPRIGELMYRDFASRHETDMYAELIEAIRTGIPKYFPEKRYDDRYLSITISPYPEGAIICCTDITDQKRAEMALRESEREKHLILSSISEVVLYQDLDYTIRWANDAAAKTLRMEPQALIGKPCYTLWYGRKAPCEGCRMQEILLDGAVHQEEKTTPDGRIWNRTGYPVRDDGGRICGLVMVWLDLTEQKRAMAEKERIQAQLFQAQKMEDVGRLAGGVAHDFNNLLTAIIGGLNMVLMKIDSRHPLYPDLFEVFQAAAHASELTRQLLLFSREHAPQFEVSSINEVIHSTLKLLHRLIGEDVSIATSLRQGIRPVVVDKAMIEQVIMNIAVNARDAMPQGGRLSILTEEVSLPPQNLPPTPDARPGHFVRIRLSDTGVGIPPDVLPRIFEPFFTTKQLGRGTGLGLSVVYSIVKQHGGWIAVESRINEGTTFDIYLPPANEEEITKGKVAIEEPQCMGNGERILLVEDEKIVRDFAYRALTQNGYQVFPAASGQEALELFEREGHFDLLFTDVVLSDMNGMDLIEKLHTKDQTLTVLISSGYTDTKSKWKLIKEKGYRYLQKPYMLNDLFAAVYQALQKK